MRCWKRVGYLPIRGVHSNLQSVKISGQVYMAAIRALFACKQ